VGDAADRLQAVCRLPLPPRSVGRAARTAKPARLRRGGGRANHAAVTRRGSRLDRRPAGAQATAGDAVRGEVQRSRLFAAALVLGAATWASTTPSCSAMLTSGAGGPGGITNSVTTRPSRSRCRVGRGSLAPFRLLAEAAGLRRKARGEPLRGSVPHRVPHHEPFRIGRLGMPPGPGPFGIADRVPAKPRHHHVGVGGVGIDRDPLPGPGFAVAL
jgi:hypothetical protein